MEWDFLGRSPRKDQPKQGYRDMEWDFLGRSPRKGQPKQGYRDMEWDFAATEIGGRELQILSDNFKIFLKTESIWSSSGSDWIGSDPIGGCELQILSENFKKFQKNREHLELIWSSYRWDVPTFWTFSASAYSLFHAILKNKKKKLEEIGRKWCRTFETNLRFTLLKKLDISKIAVLKEFTFKTGF